MEITKREIIASITIIAILLMIGMILSNKLSEKIMDKNEKYNKALKIDNNEELFRYAMSTDVGNAFIYGNLEAIDTVNYPEIGGEYLYVEKVKERYTMHTRTVTYTDSKGKIKTKTEIYWSWDVVDRESKSSNKVKFLNVEFNSSQFILPSSYYIDTLKESSDVRYKYYGVSPKMSGTIFSYLSNNNIQDSNVYLYRDMSITETVEYLDRDFSVILFWFIWIMFSAFLVYLFYYLDNNWLNN